MGDVDLPQLMALGRVPGVAMAVVRDGQTQWTSHGVRNAVDGAPVTAATSFDAASLSKPVFAYAVLQLVDAGALALDAPLSRYVADYVAGDPRARTITARPRAQPYRRAAELAQSRGQAEDLKVAGSKDSRFAAFRRYGAGRVPW